MTVVTPAVTLSLVLLASAIDAQTNTGELAGVVRDAQGGLLPGARVVVDHAETGTRIERLTDESGRYFFPSLRVERPDFQCQDPARAAVRRKLSF